MIFDTHAHYDDEAFESDRFQLLSSLLEAGISNVVNVGANIKTIKQTMELTELFPFLYGAAGVHPEEVNELNEDTFQWLAGLIHDRKYAGDVLEKHKIVAVGEIGLDYYWNAAPRDIQKLWFGRQLELAVKEDLPAIIHSREAAQDTLELIKEAYHQAKAANKRLTGVIHCFSYGPEVAKEYTAMGFFIGIGGVITFKNAKKLVDVVKEIPLENLVLETDCPYLAPEPNRGKRNSSLNLHSIAEKIALLKCCPVEQVINLTEQNARTLYQINP